MKIQSIGNINYKGLFKDCSRNNNGNWRMEYHPYCWESNNTGKMAPQEEIDLFAAHLPDNEKIFYDAGYYKSARDIYDTIFYEYYTHDDRLRSQITEMPSLNRENSLSVLKSKYKMLLDKQQYELRNLEHGYDETQKIDEISENVDGWRNLYYEKSIFSNTRNQAIDTIKSKKDEIVDKYKQLVKKMEEYIKLNDVIPRVKSEISDLGQEIETLRSARENGLLIDISRRDIYDPNKALWEELQYNLKNALSKTVALPHYSISVKDLIKRADLKPDSTEIAGTVIKYVDKIIAGKILH